MQIKNSSCLSNQGLEPTILSVMRACVIGGLVWSWSWRSSFHFFSAELPLVRSPWYDLRDWQGVKQLSLYPSVLTHWSDHGLFLLSHLNRAIGKHKCLIKNQSFELSPVLTLESAICLVFVFWLAHSLASQTHIPSEGVHCGLSVTTVSVCMQTGVCVCVHVPVCVCVHAS